MGQIGYLGQDLVSQPKFSDEQTLKTLFLGNAHLSGGAIYLQSWPRFQCRKNYILFPLRLDKYCTYVQQNIWLHPTSLKPFDVKLDKLYIQTINLKSCDYQNLTKCLTVKLNKLKYDWRTQSEISHRMLWDRMCVQVQENIRQLNRKEAKSLLTALQHD